MIKEELKELKRRENNGNLSVLMTSEVGKFHNLNNYVTSLNLLPNQDRYGAMLSRLMIGKTSF